jgi:flagellar basal-body rod protein FlgG
MVEGLYSAAAGMEAQQQQLDAIANDLSNMSTPGYQSEKVGFQDLLYTPEGASNGSPNVSSGTGASASVIGRSQLQGAIQQTGQPLDVAIAGPGYLEVRRPDGTIGLTRNGTLQLNAQGQLTTTLGMPVQPPITVPRGTNPSDVHIGPDGSVSVGSRTLGRISIVTVPAPDRLLGDGGSVYSVTAASGATRPATGATLQQGALEASNVDVAREMAEMVTAQRSYDLASRAVQYQDQLMQIANQLRS